VEQSLSADDIVKLFAKLPEVYRITFNLYEIEGYTHEEIGEMLGVATSTSRSNLTRAKRMIQKLYKLHINSEKRCHEAV
jgi:RNA polymerase sigma-70 factor (ECF subfamily)